MEGQVAQGVLALLLDQQVPRLALGQLTQVIASPHSPSGVLDAGKTLQQVWRLVVLVIANLAFIREYVEAALFTFLLLAGKAMRNLL
jgi:hypothetical protein